VSVTSNVTDAVPADLLHFAQINEISVDEAWSYARQLIREQHAELEKLRGGSTAEDSGASPNSDADRIGEDEFDRQRAEIDRTYADGRIVKLEEHNAALERLLADREAAVKELEGFKRAAQKSLGDQGDAIRKLQGEIERLKVKR